MNTTELKKSVERYIAHLTTEEKALSTRTQYAHTIEQFIMWLDDHAEITKRTVIRYKEKLKTAYKPATVNIKLAALNSLFTFLERTDLKVKQLKIQREAYCAQEKELTYDDYRRLVEAAKNKGNEKLSLVIQTIGGTGIRVSELKFITVEAVENGEADISSKGKNRKVLLPGKLCKLLKKYIRRQRLKAGSVFITRTGKPLDRSNIWRMMKALCEDAQVDPKKVFPHNLRHLFARKFYSIDHDIAKLADMLGHSSINTTRIYIMTTSREHRKQLDKMNLIFY